MSTETGQSAAQACADVSDTADSLVSGLTPGGIITAIGKLFGAQNVTKETAKSIVDNSTVSQNVVNASTSCEAGITSDQANIIDTSVCPACVVNGQLICVANGNKQSNVSDQRISCQLQSVMNLVSTINSGFQQALILKLGQKANGLASSNNFTTDSCTYINNSSTSKDYYDASQRCATSSFSVQNNVIKGCGFFAQNVQENSFKSYAQCMQSSEISADTTKDVVVNNTNNTGVDQAATGLDITGIIKSLFNSTTFVIIAFFVMITIVAYAFLRIFKLGGGSTIISASQNTPQYGYNYPYAQYAQYAPPYAVYATPPMSFK